MLAACAASMAPAGALAKAPRASALFQKLCEDCDGVQYLRGLGGMREFKDSRSLSNAEAPERGLASSRSGSESPRG